MKKWTCKLVTLVLTAALTLSLVLPVSAYPDTEPPLWQQMGYSSLEELLEEGWLTEEEYAAMAADELAWQQEQQEQLARQEAWMKAHQEEVAAFDADAYFRESYALWAGEDYTPQMYMEEWGLSREEFEAEMLDDWVYTMMMQEEEQASMAQEKVELGGSPEGINLMVGGACVPFPDVTPEAKYNRTMVPLAPAMEYLGAQVTYLPGENGVEITLDEVTLRHTIGTSQLTITEGQKEPRSLNMDAASYAKNGRTMVPVAFFAQVLGYEVFWDENYETAVLLDREALAERIDQEFTLFNRVLYSLSGEEYRQDGKSVEYGFTAQLDVTALDSLNGDKTYSTTMKGEALAGDGNVNLSFQGDFSQLAQVYQDQNPYLWELVMGELGEYVDFSQLDLEGILNGEEQTVFLRGTLPALLGLSPQEDTWVEVDREQLDLPADLDHVTMGQLALRDNLWGCPFHYYSQLLSSAGELEAVLGDSRFTQTGGSYRVAWNESDLQDLYLLEDDTFSAAFTITPTGEKSAACTLELQSRNQNAAMELSLKGSKAGLELTMDLHMKNTAKTALECRLTIAPSQETPVSQPPQGSQVTDLSGI